MSLHPLLVAAASVLSGIGWAMLAVRRSGEPARAALRPLLGGGAAFGMALAAYELLGRCGADIAWEEVLAGGAGGVLTALAIGLVEEGAKLAGIALALAGPRSRGGAARVTVGVAAGFAALEGTVALDGVPPAAALARALLAPVGHAVLAAPLALALASSGPARRRGARVALGLVAAAVLHGTADLSLATPRLGRVGYAAALLAPALLAFLHARRASAAAGATAAPPPG